jgi:hypothetical protein
LNNKLAVNDNSFCLVFKFCVNLQLEIKNTDIMDIKKVIFLGCLAVSAGSIAANVVLNDFTAFLYS